MMWPFRAVVNTHACFGMIGDGHHPILQGLYPHDILWQEKAYYIIDMTILRSPYTRSISIVNT